MVRGIGCHELTPSELEISNCPKLKDCNISDNPNLTLLTVEKLSNFDHLINNNTSLEIIETKKTDEEETYIPPNPKKKIMIDKEIILKNLSQICITPEGYLGDANS